MGGGVLHVSVTPEVTVLPQLGVNGERARPKKEWRSIPNGANAELMGVAGNQWGTKSMGDPMLASRGWSQHDGGLTAMGTPSGVPKRDRCQWGTDVTPPGDGVTPMGPDVNEDLSVTPKGTNVNGGPPTSPLREWWHPNGGPTSMRTSVSPQQGPTSMGDTNVTPTGPNVNRGPMSPSKGGITPIGPPSTATQRHPGGNRVTPMEAQRQ